MICFTSSTLCIRSRVSLGGRSTLPTSVPASLGFSVLSRETVCTALHLRTVLRTSEQYRYKYGRHKT